MYMHKFKTQIFNNYDGSNDLFYTLILVSSF